MNPKTNMCVYESLWIVNTKAPIQHLLGLDSEMFTFEKIADGFTTNVNMKDTFIRQFGKTSAPVEPLGMGIRLIQLIDETYLR